ncbi:MAG: tetratricopeptide repeat protein [Chloroflexi bacterium]|nr:tetratricopeptide repeat protein [Chloroflexota bacterium]
MKRSFDRGAGWLWLIAGLILAIAQAGNLVQAARCNAAMATAKRAMASAERENLPAALPYLASPFWAAVDHPALAAAEEALLRLEPFSAANARTLRRLGSLRLAAGEADAAWEYFTRALEQDPMDGWTRWARGWTAALLGDLAAAAADWRGSSMARSLQAACLGYLHGNEYEKARDCLTLAAAIDPMDGMALWRLSTAYQRLGQEELGLPYLAQAAEIMPRESVEYYLVFAELQERQGQPQAAAETYRRAIAAGWADYRAWRHLGRLLAAQEGGEEAAAQALREAIRLYPCSPAAYNYLIELYRRSGQEVRAGDVERERDGACR